MDYRFEEIQLDMMICNGIDKILMIRTSIVIAGLVNMLLFFPSCRSIPPDPDPMDTTKSPLTLIWKNNYDSTPGIADSIYHSQNPLIYKGDIVYSIDRVKMDVKVKIVRADGEKGTVKWQTVLPTASINSLGLLDNRVIVHSFSKTFCLNVENGEILWMHNMSLNDECSGPAYLKILNGYAYLVASNCDAPQHTYQRLIKIDIHTGKEEEVIRFNRNYSSARSPFISPPNSILNKEGEQILYFMVNWLHNSAAKIDSSIWYYAYNSTKKEMLWEKQHFEKGTEGNYSPMVWEDKVYFVGWNRVYCFDAFTGEQKWSLHMPGKSDLMGFLLTEPFLHNGVIVMKPTTRDMYGIDALSGQLIWTLKNTKCANVRYFVPYKDYFCYDCYVEDKLFMNQLSNGLEIFAYDSPNEDEGGLFSKDGIAINEEKGLLYANDGIYFMCFRINEK